MDNLTWGQIAAIIGPLTTVSGFFFAIYKIYKSNFLDRFDKLEKRVSSLERRINVQEKEIQESKEERLILLKGLLACLKGLEELNCDGPVKQGISDIEDYLINKSHE